MKSTTTLIFILGISILFGIDGLSNNPNAVGACDCASGDLIPVGNSSFEDGPTGGGVNIPLWNLILSPDVWDVGLRLSGAYVDPSCDGGQYVGMAGFLNHGEGIQQTIGCLAPGTEFNVRFSQGLVRDASSSHSGYINVTFCGTTLQSPVIDIQAIPSPGFSGWQEVELGPFIATSDSHILSFEGRSIDQSSSYPYLDGVSICALGNNCVLNDCDDGDPCTINDLQEVDACDESTTCGPCQGTPIPDCFNSVVRPCDDGDPCTENDIEEFDECNGIICVPCYGEPYFQCENTIVRSCDDGDPCTENDIEEVQECDGLICIPCIGSQISECTEIIERPCDDGNPCTIDDMEEIDECNNTICSPCQGTPIDICEETFVRPCDDGNPCTINDIEEVNECDSTICTPCEGIYASSCNSTVVRSCNDGDVCTTNDVEEVEKCDSNVVCSPCQGVPVDCSNGVTQIVACDDGDSTTVNDVQTILVCDNTICIPCLGEPVDCFNGNTSRIPCDDGDPCTHTDVEVVVDSTGQICIACEGIPLDCGDSDFCELTRSCDDGDSCTINDMETILLQDSSICVPCSGVTVIPNISIDSIVCNEDFSSYSIYLQSNFEEIENNLNVPITELGNGRFIISGIDSSSSIIINLSYTGTLCSTEVDIDPPNCDCGAIADAGPNQVLNCYNNGAIILGGPRTSSGGNFNYSWIDENGNELGIEDSILVTEEGNYILIVEDLRRNCTDSSWVSVFDVRNEPNAVITAFPDTIINCAVESVELFVDPQQDAIFEWTTHSSSLYGRIVEIMESGIVTLVVTDTITGCRSQSIIEIISFENYPLVFLNEPDVLSCKDSLVEISISSISSTGDPFVHQWYESGGLEIIDENGSTIIVDEPGVYILETMDTVNQCINRDTVEVGSDFQYPLIDAGDSTYIPCDGRSVNLLANADDILLYDLIWSSTEGNILSGDRSLTPEVSGAAWYYLLASHQENGCVTLDSVFVNYTDNEISANVLSVPPSCPGASDAMISIDLIGAQDPVRFIINGVVDQSESPFQNLEADSYFIEVIDALGCSFDTTIIISDPESLFLKLSEDYFEVEQSSFIDMNLLTNANRVDSIIWPEDIEVLCENCLNPRFKAERSGDYQISIVNEQGCIASDQFRVLIKEKFYIFVPSAFSPNADALNDRLFIHTSDNIEEVRIFEIYARWGERIFSVSNIPPNDPQYGWDGSFLGRPMNSAVFVYYAVLKDRNGKEHIISGDVTLLR